MPEEINIVDIAKYAGVSVSTVSRVINDRPDVNKETRRKVMEVIEQYAYIPNNNARNLKRESMRAIGIVVKGFTNPLFVQMLDIIQNELSLHDYTAIFQPVDPNKNEVEAAISMVKEKKPEGLIFLGGKNVQPPNLPKLLVVPFVIATITFQQELDPLTYSSVTIDNYQEAYRVTDYICKHGHSRVAAISFSPDDNSTGFLRINGFRKALIKNNCYRDESSILYAGESSMEAGYKAAQRLIAQTDFTCLFCASDLIALGAIRALAEAGKHVPEDISVIGFDGIDAGKYSIPSLTTVQQPYEKMAYECVRILMKHLAKGAPHVHKVFKPVFQERESFRPL